MYFTKRSKEPTPVAHTSVWMCCEEACSGWMREDYSFAKKPTCPLCSSMMEKKMKMIPVL
ncbi:cold-inducible protein YdjO-related protein [Paenibacillus filicis]|uniref:Cold-inducible protein YdjO-related protein n=1 Tax=Paenibacillus gyeongsangnamensis TaxID=3388067 RepID=A0ABT4QD39_9BACL|nr:cold-inducible protein YdjO-related protein [Paenibacillus filicis]MCZ8514723.1 cold-inducible protein YdjO-related protein [Paenibacillus filicis]